MLNHKKGVSLITVLMFMLVATIAATATYKWLSSEGDSSTARMREQSAIKAATSGIDNARSWMTMHANEFGAIVRQFKTNGQPILLNPVISQDSKNDNFHVWLVGVNDAQATYKVKLLSEGVVGRYKHRESAILNVSGLYQVEIPHQTPPRKAAPFDYTYFGGSTHNHGEMNAASMLVNGDWQGNPNHVGANFVVTGDATLSGNDVLVGGTACIGGDFDVDNGMDAGAIYVHGTTTKFTMSNKGQNGITGDAYFDGPLYQGKAGGWVRIGGNLTINDTLATRQKDANSRFQVGGNFCIEKNGYLDLGGSQVHDNEDVEIGSAFSVQGDVWIPGHHQVYNEAKNNATAAQKDFSAYYNQLQLGMRTDPKSTIYIKDGYKLSEYKQMRDSKNFNDWNGWYKPYVDVNPKEGMPGADEMYYFYYVEPGVTDVEYVNQGNGVMGYNVGGYSYADGNQYHYGHKPVDVKKKMSPYCKTGDNNRPECHASPWFTSKGTLNRSFSDGDKPVCAEGVKRDCDDVWEKRAGCDKSEFFVPDMLTTAYEEFKKKANVACPEALKKWDTGISKRMNDCYKTASAANKYNGYLVVEPQEFADAQTPAEKLDGKFIIILSRKLPNSFNFPATAGDDDFVFMYVADNVAKDTQMEGMGSGDFNYFIYTRTNIGGGEIRENKNYDKLRCALCGWNYECKQTYCVKSSYTEKHFKIQNGTLKGSMYAVAENCAKIPDMMLKAAAANPDLMQSLYDAGVLCPADGSPCGGSTASSSSQAAANSSGAEEENPQFLDSYHVAIAPQLNVSLESQYEAKESSPSKEEDIAPSYIILPRIAYLPQDPEGTLDDYYSLINLNGGEVEKKPEYMSCVGPNGVTVAKTEALRLTTGDILPEGIYTCTYDPHSASYENMTSYLVVEGMRSETPYVSLGAGEADLSRGSVVEIKGKVKSTSRGGQCSFSISVSEVPDGWTLQPSNPYAVAMPEGASGGRTYYAGWLPTSANDEIKTLFTVKAGTNAASGQLYFMIDSPFEGCIPGEPATEVVKIVGDAKIIRKDISDYCKIEENKEICEENGYKDASKRLDCENLMQTKGDTPNWIEANGADCSIETTNRIWNCKTRSPITLTRGSGVPDYCDIIIPSENNTIANPESEETYELYGSIKRKQFEVYLKLDGAKNNSSRVVVESSILGSEEEVSDVICRASSPLCTLTVIAGTKLKFIADPNGNDDFKFWSCEGVDCFDDRGHVTTEEWEYPYITGTNTIVANFNKRDEHCFYEDFAGMMAFCAEGQTHCIDTCRTRLSKGTVCGAKQSAQQNAEWLMMYNNGQGGGKNATPVPPAFYGTGDDPRGIYTTNTKNANNQNGTQSVILSTADAGPYGRMTSMMTTTIISKPDGNGNDGYLNSGLIFRGKMEGTNNSEFLIMNVFGTGSGNSGKLTARVCKIVGHSINNNKDGNCVYNYLTDAGGNNITVKNTNMVKISMTIGESDILYVTGKVGDKVGTTSFNLAPFNTNDQYHKYVGMDLSDAELKIYDIGWESSSYSEECWDVPSVICSFRANYLGGRVPQNEDVSPWAGVSSWFDENKCVKAYYYNGSDNANKYGGDNPGSLGSRLNDSLYKFTEAGPHGYADANQKIHKDAKIKMSCPGIESSLELNPFEYSCGFFDVGVIESCKEDFDLITSQVSGSGSAERSLSLATGSAGINLREATLIVDMGFLSDLGSVKIWLKSGTDGLSLPGYVNTKNAVNTLNVDVMSNADGFDPQDVTGIVIAGGDGVNYTINSISAACPYSVSLQCNSVATLDIASKSWIVKTKAGGNSSSKCYGSSDDSGLSTFEEMSCSGDRDWTFTYGDDVDLVSLINEHGLSAIKFTIKAVAENGNEKSCTVVSDAVGAMGEPSCSISPAKVAQGAGMPTFKFTLSSTNCPASGCPYEVTKINESTKTTGNATPGQPQNITENKNTEGSPLPIGDNYTYTVTSYGKTCSQTFEVEAKKTPPSNLTCSLDEGNGTLSASVTNSDNVEYTYVIGVFDANGNKIEATSGSSTAATVPSFTKQISNPGKYIYRVNVSYAGSDLGPCEKTLTINDVAPTCANVDVGSITKGEVISGSVMVSHCSGSGVSCTFALEGGTSFSTSTMGSDGRVPFSFYGASGDVNNMEYTFKITRTNDNLTGSCKIKVNIQDAGGNGCHCSSYCSNGCDNIKTASVDGQPLRGCMFITSATTLAANTGWWKVNGQTVSSGQLCWDNGNDCSNALNNYAKVDGGWYVEAEAGWARIVTNSPATNPCGGGSGGTSSATPASSASGGVIPVTVSYGGYVPFEAGKTYNVTLANGGVFRCRYEGSNAFNVGTFNGSAFDASQNSGGQATISNPGSGKTVTFVVNSSIPYSIECATDW